MTDRKATWYQENRERILEHKRIWYQEHKYECREKSKRKREAEKRETEKQAEPKEKRQRPAGPQFDSWLSGWLTAHGMTAEEGREQSSIDGATWEILLRGGRTVPGIALIAGHNLGMSPEEVRNIGVTLDPSSRRTCENLPIDQYP